MRTEFPQSVRAKAALRCKGRCENRECNTRLPDGGYHYDHVIPDALGGEPTLENCEVLCLPCHRAKTTRSDVPRIAKAKRQEAKSKGTQRLGAPIPGSKRSGWRKRLNGTVERRSQQEGRGR